jgi:hypothetical protein
VTRSCFCFRHLGAAEALDDATDGSDAGGRRA